MKQILFASLLLLSFSVQAQNSDTNHPLAIEDARMDGYLSNRKLPSVTIQVNNMPDSIKKIEIKYTLVTFGANFQVKEFTQTDAKGFARIVLNQNLPYQQIWLSVGDYLYAGIYVNTATTITIDASKINKDGIYMIGDGVTYSGEDGEFNKVMNTNVIFKQDLKSKLQELSLDKVKNDDLSSRVTWDDQNSFYIDTESALFIQEGNQHSYTFTIYEPSSVDIENLVLSYNESTNDYSAYKTSYDLTQEQKNDALNNNYNNGLSQKLVKSIEKIEFNSSTILNRDPIPIYPLPDGRCGRFDHAWEGEEKKINTIRSLTIGWHFLMLIMVVDMVVESKLSFMITQMVPAKYIM